ncbi:MAG: efflux RND transporter periplasmic adaptor subunit [Rhizomicrobium sp.]|jgi:RND family efflux transporter MFP subunit
MPDAGNPLRYTPPRRLKLAGIVAACVAILAVAIGLIGRGFADQGVAQWTDAQALPTVKIINLAADTRHRALVLPGDVEAFNSAPIYARVSGYLKQWYVDIGAKVKSGQVLATIDVPDQDQQLAQAKADLATAVANEKLSAITAKRWNALLKENAVAPQDVDEKNGDLAAKIAAVASAKANVDRLQDLETFKNITAPFDGVVTSRSTDIGALIVVGAPGQTPLFTVADESKLRIYVRVPQNYAWQITPGMTASFDVPEQPGANFSAAVAATADAVDETTGTLLVQLQIDNSDRKLKPGDYAQVHFALPSAANTVQVPASALMFRDSGMEVATLGRDGRVVIKPITIARDFGTSVQVASGLTTADRVIDNPPDSLRQGDAVRVAR